MFASLKGIRNEEMADRVKKAVEDVGLTEKIHMQTNANPLSGGQKRKLSVVLAFIADPLAVFLDEPTSGMDVSSRRAT